MEVQNAKAISCIEKMLPLLHPANSLTNSISSAEPQPHLKAIGDVEFRGRDPHQVIHQHHDHDGDEDGKVADG